MNPLHFTINIDGGSRGNPGLAAFGYVIAHDGETVLDGNGTLPHATNNVAEYTALIRALEKAAELNAATVEIRSDSELLVRQMNGQYKVKNAGLLPLFEEAQDLRKGFKRVSFTHIPREQNREADRLCNEAMDGKIIGAGQGSKTKPAAPKPSRPARHALSRDAESSERSGFRPSDQDALLLWRSTLGEAERLIRDAQFQWVDEGSETPTPRDVMQAIAQLLESRGFIRKPD
jgi:ribonuclease HI